MTGRALLSTAAVVAGGAALVLAGALWASFSAPSVPGGSGAAAATSLPTGSTPTAVANGGTVHVQWPESTVLGHAVSGYVVRRYDADSGAIQVTGVGCQGTITATECTEATPPGDWRYTVTPVLDSWVGGESGESGGVVVGSASMTLVPTVVGGVDHPLPATLTGSVQGFASGEHVLFKLDSASGRTLAGTVAGTATPPAAAVGADGSAAVTVTVPDDAAILDGGHSVYAVGDNSGVASSSVVVDRLPPTVTLSDPGSPLRGTILLSASAGDSTAGIGSVTLQRSPAGAGAWTTIAIDTVAPYTASFDTAGVGDGLYDLRAVATDGAGTPATSTVANRVVDNTAPSQALSLTAPSGAYLAGSTLYFKRDAAGSFKLADAITDAGSGPVSAGFPDVGTSGWTHAAETISGASPYTSNLYSWGAGAATPADQSIAAADAAGNTGTSTLHFVSDTSAPSGGFVGATGLVGTGSRYSTSTTLSIAFDDGSDSGSGLAGSGAVLLREQGTLASSDGQADGTCDYTGQSYAAVATGPASPYVDDAANGVQPGKCYRYEYVVSDRVGNQATYASSDVKVVTAAPSATVGLSGATGSTFVSGSTVYTNPQAGRSGSFSATATASDALAGLAGVDFPSLAGFDAGGGGVASPGPYRTTYSWSGAAASASGSQTVTATSNSSLTGTAAFTVTPDTTAPSTTGSGADASWHNTAVTVSLSSTDAGAGVASVTYQVDGGTPVNTSGSSASVTVTAPANGTNDGRHTIAYYATDAVGNVESAHTVQLKIDTQAPTAASTFPNDGGEYNAAGWNAGCTSAICGTATDPGSGVGQVVVTIQQVSSGKYWSGTNKFDQASETTATHVATGTTAWSLAFGNTNFAADGSYVIRVYTTDAFGNTTPLGTPAQEATIVYDKTAPNSAITFPVNNAKYGDTSWNAGCGSAICGTATDATAGVAGVQLSVQQVTGSKYWDPATGSFSSAAEVKFDATGTTSWSAPFPASNFPAEGSYKVRSYATDVAGNADASPALNTLTIDRTPPAQAFSLSVPSGAYVSGSNLYFKSDASGSFKFVDTETDTGTGPASAAFPAIGTTGWTHGAETVGGASPYTSSLYSWTAGAATPADQTVTATDAGGTSGTTALRFVPDLTAPGGGSVDANGLLGTGSRYSTSTTLSIALAKGSDGGSGLAAAGAQLLREQGTLASSDGQANGTCDYTGQSYSVVATDPASPYADTAASGVASGKCYRYEYVVPDNVGNQATYTSPDVKVVTTQPNETVAVAGATGSTFVSGTTVYTNPQAGRSGGFTVSAAASDAAAGLVKVNFPALTGFGAGGGDVASPGPYQTAYSWSGAGATATGAQTVTAPANSSQTRTATFTVTPDTIAPTTTQTGADANWHNAPVTTSLSASDAGSGVASVTYQVDGGTPVNTSGSGASVTVSAPANGSNDGTHTITYYAVDNVGNVESAHSVQVKIDTQAPSAASTFPAASGNYSNTGWNNGCTSAICGTASDAGSGVSAVKVTVQQVSSGMYWASGSTFNVASEASALKTATGTTSWSLAFPQTNFPSDGTYVVRVYTTDSVGNATAVGSPVQQIAFVFDRTAPSPTVTFPASAAFYNDAGWNLSACGGGTGNVCGTATDATSGVASDQVSLQQGSTSKYWDPGTSSFSSASEVKVDAIGTTSWSLGLFPASNFPAESSYTVRSYATDAAGNTSATPTGTTFTIDRTAPAQAFSLSVPSGAYLSGLNLYFKSDTAGSFKLVDTETDSSSGPASAAFPAIGTTGWTHSAETVSGSSPYTSSLYSWSGGAATPANQAISATDGAGNSGSNSIHFVADTATPSGGSVDATGLVGTGSRYSTSTTLSIALAKGSDGGSGLAASGAVLKREQGTLASSDGQANGTCDYTGQSYSTIAADPASPYTDNAAGGILTGKCYRYQYVVPDNVGNSGTYTSGDIEVEAAAAVSLAPVVSLSGASGNTAISGTTVFTNPQAGESGSFTVQATASDSTVGVQKLSFPSLTGFSAGGGDVGSPGPYQTSYSWSGAGASASGSQTVTATGDSSLTRTGTFTVTPDTTAPTTTASGADASWHNSAVTVSLSSTDAGAGVGSVTYQVDGGTAVNTSGSSANVTVSAPANGSNDGTHTIAYYSTDAVGNVESTHSVQVKIDTQAPSASSTFPAASGNYNTAGWNAGCTSAICGSASDPGSGVSTVKLTIQQVSSGLYWASGSTFNVASEASALKTAPGTTSWSLAFPATNFPTDGSYVVRVYTTDALGNTAAVGSPVQQVSFVVDRTAPSAVVTFPASAGKYKNSGWNSGCSSAICGTASDATSGVALVQVSIQQGAGSYWDPNAGSFSSAGEIKVTASGTTSWSLAFAGTNFPADGSYTVRAYSTDAAGNVSAAAAVTVTIDRTAPTQTITTASSNAFVTGSADAWTVYYNGNTSGGSFALSDTAADSGGSGLSGNDVWAAFNPGGGWVSKAQASCLASGACASGTYSWTGTNPTSGVTTTVTTQDAAGNSDVATLTFTADAQAPNAPTMTTLPAQIKNGQSLSVTSAVDNGPSGVKSVTYYYCSGSSCTPATQIGSPATTGPNYALTWSAQPLDGTYTVAAKVTDNVGNVSALGPTQTVTIDNTVPTVTAVALSNGGVAKTADLGDKVTITYSEKIKASTFCSSWVDDGTTQTLSGVTLNFTNNGMTDALTMNSTGGCTFHLQQVVAGDYIGATLTIPTSSIAWDATAKTLTITLGAPVGVVKTNVTAAKPTYTPDGALTDWAGNAISTATFSSGTATGF